jgi:hypothetical protein
MVRTLAPPRSGRNDDSERGAILILALSFVVVVSVIVAALSTWAINGLNSTTNFNTARSLDYAASGATEIAIQSIRYTPLVGTVQNPSGTIVPLGPSWCWGNGPKSTAPAINGITITVWCSTVENLASSSTRLVTFYACRSSTSESVCINRPVLQAEVSFNDYPPGGGVTLTNTCSQTCGEGANLVNWTWGASASSLGGTTANSITVTSSAPSNAVTGGATYSPTASATSGDVVIITSATSAVCTFISGTVSFVSVGTCTLAFNDPGNSTYAAAAQVNQSFSVGKGASVITVTSTAPSSATVGGPTYVPTATSISGDTVTITSATTSVCTISSGIVSFGGAGTCTLNFNDPGNSLYNAAAQVQQSFTVILVTNGSYSGSSSGSLPVSPGVYYAINTLSSVGSATSTANALTPGTAEHLTGFTFSIDSTSSQNHTATVGIITGGVWSPTALTCTIGGGSNNTTCTILASVSVPVGSSINVLGVGGTFTHTGSWVTTYTQP